MQEMSWYPSAYRRASARISSMKTTSRSNPNSQVRRALHIGLEFLLLHEEISGTDSESGADAGDVVDRYVGFRALYRTDEGPMHFRPIGQLLLAEPQPLALGADLLREHSSKMGWRGNWHAIRRRPMTPSHSTAYT